MKKLLSAMKYSAFFTILISAAFFLMFTVFKISTIFFGASAGPMIGFVVWIFLILTVVIYASDIKHN